MIEIYELQNLLKIYGINADKFLQKNQYLLDLSAYYQIQQVLDYLIHELNIQPQYIEKCPSIMYRSVSFVKYNYDFLKNTGITISNVETFLHLLNTKSAELVRTYKYILANYGILSIEENPLILSVSVEKIKEIEALEKEESVESYGKSR